MGEHGPCSYCSDGAKGLGEEGELTCGDPTSCVAIVEPLPRVAELSSVDDEDEEDDEETDDCQN
jgi:hypothetical protein